MSEANNGQHLFSATHNATTTALESFRKSRQGNYTGQRLARDRPRIYREVMRLLSEGNSVRKICRACHVTRETVRAVERREALPISTRKQELAVIAARVAQTSIEQIEDQVAGGKIKGVGLVPVFGVCVDKLQSLSGDPLLRIEHSHSHIHAHINDCSYQELLAKLPRRNTTPVIDTPPQETLPVHPE